MRNQSPSVGSSIRAIIVLCLALPAGAMELPDPLRCEDGTQVTTAELWESRRRPETLRLFRDHVYGWPSVERPEDLSFHLVRHDERAMDGAATLKVVEIRIGNSTGSDRLRITATIFIPNAVQGPVPGLLLIYHRSKAIIDPARERKSGYWPAEEVIARGYMISVFHVSDVDPDNNDFGNGVHRVFDGGVRQHAKSWGALAAWAWGASRVMDYFETDADIDQSRIAVVGHSRTGKAALVAGASDQRFYLTISNNSGEGGAALSRHRRGESLASIAGGFPYWFNGVYPSYGSDVDAMPTDQHQLIALMAPRAVYVASASDDSWADPAGEFLALVHARGVYGLYGFAGIGDASFPDPGQQIHGDRMGYHLREGKHSLTAWDWARFMDYFDVLRAADAP